MFYFTYNSDRSLKKAVHCFIPSNYVEISNTNIIISALGSTNLEITESGYIKSQITVETNGVTTVVGERVLKPQY